jgi:hypothetical protein
MFQASESDYAQITFYATEQDITGRGTATRTWSSVELNLARGRKKRECTGSSSRDTTND